MDDSRELTRQNLDVAAGLAEISAKLSDLPEMIAGAMPKAAAPRQTVLMTILTSLATAAALWAGSNVISMRETLAVHLSRKAHEWADERHVEHDRRFNALERFQLVGRRYTWERGTRAERATLLVAQACVESNSAVRERLLSQAIEELERLKAEPAP